MLLARLNAAHNGKPAFPGIRTPPERRRSRPLVKSALATGENNLPHRSAMFG
jgi:hypothetical protein